MARLWISFFLVYATLILLSCLHLSTSKLPTPTNTITIQIEQFNNVTDRKALLSFMSMISRHQYGALASWNDSDHFCQWKGVTCSDKKHPQRVTALVLSSLNLTGSISSAVSNLTFLRKIDLSDNHLQGIIPHEIGRLSWLQYFNLTQNNIEGGIPVSLSRCSNLRVISFRSNNLHGEIPPALSNLSLLRFISLRDNQLTGYIPSAFGNFSSLSVLSLTTNQLVGSIPPTIGNIYSLTVLELAENSLSGSIPPSIGKITKLTILDLMINNLSGVIPPSLWNISNLSGLGLGHNNLSGMLPSSVGQALPFLQKLDLYRNSIHGPIPASLSNASSLERIGIDDNMFSGTIPSNLGKLQNLKWLILSYNQLEVMEPNGWDFLTSLTNCTNLKMLELNYNQLSGMLPNSVANLTTKLQLFFINNNQICGKIPPDIGNLINLTFLLMNSNSLSGPIPASVGMLKNLNILDFSFNKLSGEIPLTLGNLSKLNHLFLSYNKLTGIIPANLGSCHNLIKLNLEVNKLTGGIPKEILTISSLSEGLYLGSNSLTGSIPPEIGNLINVEAIDVNMNMLFGEIPITIGACLVLQYLNLGGNSLQGSIPLSMGALKGIQELDVSNNHLSGRIPNFLQDLQALYYLNLSFNNFKGDAPKRGVFSNASAVSVQGNKKLCGGNPYMHLPSCPSYSSQNKHDSHTLSVIIATFSSSILLLLLICFLLLLRYSQKSKRKCQAVTPVKEHPKISYAELRRATNGFSRDNFIGMGSFCTVYKGILDDDPEHFVAVKVLNLQLQGASKTFISECEALRNIRHKNLVRIITVCSSVDFIGNDFKAVVLEFMANGNLNDWLHPNKNEQSEEKNLNLMQRLKIAIDMASALDYLHHHIEKPIVHCDVKPNNILLDGGMTAHIADFGLARFVKKINSKYSQDSTSSTGLKGTIGYIAPEYGAANKVSAYGDVYSYGILLLEMFTAKRPTDHMFKDGLSLKKFVELAYPERVMHIIDARLLSGGGDISGFSQNLHRARVTECVSSVLRIAILCSNELPNERMETSDILRSLHESRDAFLKNGGQ